MQKRIDIVLIEDDDGYRRSFADYLTKSHAEEFYVLGQYSTYTSAIQDQNFRKADIVLLDIGLGDGENGVFGVMALKEKNPHVEIAIWTVHEDDDEVIQAIQHGANGYIIKTGESFSKMVETIRHLIEGRADMSPQIARKVVKYVRRNPGFALTKTEIAVLEEIESGKAYREVAQSLGRTLNGVRFHLKNIFIKMGVHSRAEALKRFRLYKLSIGPR